MNKLIIAAFVGLLYACGGGDDFVPKPHGYPKMDFPVKQYHQFDSIQVPYSFEIPDYAAMEKDTTVGYTADPNWFNLNFKPFGATLHLTYYRFNSWDVYDSLVYDSRKLVNKHLQRADDIIEERAEPLNPNVRGVIFSIQGNTATNYNFYVTDSARHFLRGALYFNNHTEQDSIAPAFQYLKKDVEHLIQTLKWK